MSTNGSYPFDGFSKPTYTQVPDEVLDVLMPDLSESELKVLLYVVRRTFGFGKDRDAISTSQMIEGITTKDGRVLDRGTGLSRSSVRRGVQGLLDKGILTISKVVSEEGDYETNVYGLRFKSDQGVVPNSNHPRSKFDPPVVPNSAPQETVEQQTVSQERPVEASILRKVHPDIVDKYDDVRLGLLPYAEDLGREMNDQAPLSSTTTRLVNIHRRSGLDLDTFIDRILTARAITKERSASIKASPTGSGFGRKPKMGYFFSILEDLTDQQRRQAD